MRAYVIRELGGPDGLGLENRPDPRPGPGQLVVRVRAASLNYRDLMIIKGTYSRNLPLPLVPLSDGAGEVVEVGPGVTKFRPGDRVAGCFMTAWQDGPPTEAASKSALGGAVDGMLAELVVLPEGGVVRSPESLSDEEVATLPCAAVTAWNALFEGGLRAGQTVLVQGTGGVSMFALQLAKAAGARVIATSSSDAKLARAREMGASDGINYKTTPDWDVTARNLTEGLGVDHVVEVGGAGTLPLSVKATRMGGQIALIGVLAGGTEFDPRQLMMKGIRLRGIYVGSRAMFEGLNRLIATQRIKPTIDRVFPFDRAGDAYRYFDAGSHFGKVVIAF